MISYTGLRYDAHLEDEAGDPFIVKAADGAVTLTDLDEGLVPEERCANLLFTPIQAMYLAAHLIRAATVAMIQERQEAHASR